MVDLILGTAQLARPYGFASPALDATEVLHQAERLGFKAIDTAPVYGSAEYEIGKANVNLAVHTKLAPGLSPRDSLARSLAKLGTDKVDTFYIHERLSGVGRGRSVVSALESLRGLFFDRIAVSIYSLADYNWAIREPTIDVIQVPHNVFDRRFSGNFLEPGVRAGKVIYARSIFLQGLLLSSPKTLHESVRSLRQGVEKFQWLADRWSLTPLEAAIQFVRMNSALSALVVGAVSTEQLSEISAAIEVPLNDGFLGEVTHLALPSWPQSDPRRWTARDVRA